MTVLRLRKQRPDRGSRRGALRLVRVALPLWIAAPAGAWGAFLSAPSAQAGSLPPEIGSPCRGVVVRADVPRIGEESLAETTLVIETGPGSGAATFDWMGPYYDFSPTFDHPRKPPAELELDVEEWTVEATASGIRHRIEIQWPPFREIGLRFASAAGACSQPRLICDSGRCALGE